MKKSLASRSVRLVREGIKRGLGRIVSTLLGSRSYRLLGIPRGIDWSERSTQELYPAAKLPLKLPKTLDKTPFWRYREALEAKRGYESGTFFTLPKGCATALGGNLNEKGRLVTSLLKPIDGQGAHQHDLFNFSSKRFSPRIYRSDKPVATLAAGWQGEFYHWMFQVLPRIHLVEKAGYPVDLLYVAQKSAFQRQTIQILGIPKEGIIDASQYDAVSAPSIVVPSTPSHPTEWVCAFLRERLAANAPPSKRRRIYVSRRDAAKRRVVNEEEVYGLLKEFGFERVELSSLPFHKQVEAFCSAEMVVGPHGAGFSHLVFCDPGTPFLEFFHPGYINLSYYYLANVMGHPYHYLLGEGERYPDGFDPHIDPDISVDLNQLKKMLHDLDR